MKAKLLIPLLLSLLCACSQTEPVQDSWWQMRGLVLSTKELAEVDWPELAKRSGINTIGTHITPSEVAAFMASPEGKAFRRKCRKYGITVEHQLHAMGELLPRELFAEDSTMFRMDSAGRRTADFNCCIHSEKALEIIASNAAGFAKLLRPGNHRYYFWLDDNAPVCCCPFCAELSPSEQALIVENRMLREIRKQDSEAKLAHLAYSFFMPAPRKVTPDEGIFLEFAPIYRSWDVPLTQEDALCPRGYPVSNGDNLRWLEENLEVFPAEDAVVLEYWVDASLFSRWKRPAVELPWHPDVCASDLATYAGYGLRNVTSFAVFMDAGYFERFPSTAPIEEYGRMLESFRHFHHLNDPWYGWEDATKVSFCRSADAINVRFDVKDSTLTVCRGEGERTVDNSDRAELFISCDPEMKRYYGFEMDPEGKMMDYRNSFYRQFDYGWDSGIKPVSTILPEGYRVEVSFPYNFLRSADIEPDGPLHIGLYRADATGSGDIHWFTLADPHTPEPDFHVPASLFDYF